MPPKFGGGNSCKRCSKTVYQAEERKDSEGGYWHKQCFSCKNCPKKLDSTNLNMNKGRNILLAECRMTRLLSGEGRGASKVRATP